MITVNATKYAAEVVPVEIDWAKYWLGTDTLSGEPVATVQAGTITVLAQVTTAGKTQLLVSGGAAGTVCKLQVLATAAGGKKTAAVIYWKVL